MKFLKNLDKVVISLNFFLTSDCASSLICCCFADSFRLLFFVDFSSSLAMAEEEEEEEGISGLTSSSDASKGCLVEIDRFLSQQSSGFLEVERFLNYYQLSG